MNVYKELLAIRNIDNNTERGYRFEQTIREIQPWDRRPPLAVSLHSEQLDGVFIWRQQPYLIESKAKRDPITVGSHDWEDFELKIRRRKNSVVGLFCSLYPISEDVYKRAYELNIEGYFVIILAGDFWDEINDTQLPLKDLLEYMNLFGRVKFLTSPPKLDIILSWCYDKETTERKIIDACRKNSSSFLRRHKSPFHSNLYISRDVDSQIDSYSKELKPSVLQKTRSTKKRKSVKTTDDFVLEHHREKPKQICVIRDYSGSGKTTLSLEISNCCKNYFGTGTTANEYDVDIKFVNFFQSLGDRCGLIEIITSNKPIIFVVDSLDEANYDLGKKRKEILSILKYIEELNEIAEQYQLIAYPLLVVFTVREDYWRDWESLLEGRRKYDISKRISSFAPNELLLAIEKYSNSYGYVITNSITSEARRILSTPINLLIFSETYQYQGNIEITEIWEGNVIDSYFTRKKDDIHKRHINGFTSNVFFQLIASLAFHVVKSKKNILSEEKIRLVIEDHFSVLTPYDDEIINAIVSELILVRDSEKLNHLRFRHSRFIEFLLAYHIVNSISKGLDIKKLDDFAQVSFESGIVLMFRVHDDIRYIGKTKFPTVISSIEDYYSKSNFFVTKKLRRLRSDLAVNNRTSKEDIDLVLKNINGKDPELISNAFFVIASRGNMQAKLTILNLFIASFSTCLGTVDRYKQIVKLEYHNLLTNEAVLNTILLSSMAKDWEVYLGLIIKGNLQQDFSELWKQADCDQKFHALMDSAILEDWQQVKKLLNIIIEGKSYIIGELC